MVSAMFEQYDDVVTVRELCEMLHIGRNMAYELVNNQTIACVRLGRKILVPKRSVIEYLNTSCPVQQNS